MNKLYFFNRVLWLMVVCCPLTIAANSADLSSLPNVACHYEMRVTPHQNAQAQTTSWFFWRTNNASVIQTQDADGDHGELWQRTINDHIQYRKLYHSDKTAVEYMSTDNMANNLQFDWRKLSTMLSQQEMDALKPVEKTQVLGRDAELRTGESNGQHVEVSWLTHENLPASIVRTDKDRTVELRLIEINALSTAQHQPIALAEIANYRQIDATDFGDMENDPFVKKIMAAEGHHH